MPRFFERSSILTAAATFALGTVVVAPQAAQATVRPSALTCAALYYMFAGPNSDDPGYLAMHDLALQGGAYHRSVENGSGVMIPVAKSKAEAIEQDKQAAIAIARLPENADGLSQNTIEQIHACAFGWMIRPPVGAIEAIYGKEDFEKRWATALEEKQRKDAADQQAASRAKVASTYQDIDSTLRMCLQLQPPRFESDLRQRKSAEAKERQYANLKVECVKVRQIAIDFARANRDSDRADEYRRLRFPWE